MSQVDVDVSLVSTEVEQVVIETSLVSISVSYVVVSIYSKYTLYIVTVVLLVSIEVV